MKILLSNDDGINSEPLKILAKKLSEKYEVLVVAPKNNRSAVSHSLTVFSYIEVDKVEVFKNCVAYSVDGTPADCVKFALLNFKDFDPDIVVAGINVGHNLGADILYSGTVSIGYEAAFYGKSTFCFSTLSFAESDYEGFADIALRIIEKYNPIIKSGTILNVNFPDLPANKVKGIKASVLSKVVYEDEYVKEGEGKYRINSRLTEKTEEKSDLFYTLNGYVSITPLLYDKTDYSQLKELTAYE